MSIKVTISCLATRCRHHSNNDILYGHCKDTDLVTIGENGQCLWATMPISELLESAKPSHNNARDEILLCADERISCSSHVSVCKLNVGGCNMQHKTSPVA